MERKKGGGSKWRKGEREARKRERMETVVSRWKIHEALGRQGSVFMHTIFEANSSNPWKL